jgi:hypothetical protein
LRSAEAFGAAGCPRGVQGVRAAQAQGPPVLVIVCHSCAGLVLASHDHTHVAASRVSPSLREYHRAPFDNTNATMLSNVRTCRVHKKVGLFSKKVLLFSKKVLLFWVAWPRFVLDAKTTLLSRSGQQLPHAPTSMSQRTTSPSKRSGTWRELVVITSR